MSKRNTIYVIIGLFIVIAGITYWSIRGIGSGSEEPVQPVAKVAVVPLTRGKIDETIVAYGTVIAAIGQTQTFSMPFESQVRKVLVTAGQVIDINTPLIEISPSPASRLQFAEARTARDTAKNNLDLVNMRFQMKLSTRQDVIVAEQNLETAELNMKSMEEQGAGKNQTILAKSNGLVNQINVEQGQMVAAGTPMITTIGRNQISVILGVENEYISLLKTGQDVQLYQVNAREKKMIEGKIGLVTHRVNQQTRMVDVFVIPQTGADLLLNQYVEAHIVIRSDEGFIVPHSAVLPEEGKHILYTVENDHAVKNVVNIGLENSEQVQVFADDLKQGQQVVVVGNYELENDMAVEVAPK
jgi:RND family efflux transporter MFP subunit